MCYVNPAYWIADRCHTGWKNWYRETHILIFRMNKQDAAVLN